MTQKNTKSNNANKKKGIIVIATSFVLVVFLILGIVLGGKLGKQKPKPNDTPNDTDTTITIPTPGSGQFNMGSTLKPDSAYQTVSLGQETFYTNDQIVDYNYDSAITTTTAVGYSSEKIGTVTRSIPTTTRDEGLGVYPKYGYTLSTVIGSSDQAIAARNALIAESNYVAANGTRNNSGNGGGYTWMDKDGYLYLGTTADPIEALDKYNNHRRLYKHTASKGLYFGDVADDEPGIIKRVTIRPRNYNSYSVTGVYAPAGEIIKIQISKKDMEATGGLTIHIGQALYNGQSNNIWTAKGQMQRFPNLLNTMVVNKNTATLEGDVYTAYVGSYIGGPLYIRNTGTTFTATISGGVAYSHFILGSTTKEEFEANKRSSAPYFDLEVWNYGVLHSGPKIYAQNFSYEDIYKAAILWEKVSSVTTTGSNQGIVFLYDPFVAAGAAVAFPGRSSVNCPTGWMSSSLNYNSIVSSGAWGNFHEYHHNFQGYGVGNGGEVTNNGMTLVSYALFTKISSKRGISNFGAAGLGGWNNYTSATLALEETLKIARPDQSPSNGNQGLALYATLLHNFGPDAYIKAKIQQQSRSYGQIYSGYLRAWQDITHNNMTYFFKDILKGIDQTVADKANTEWGNPDYPMFVPVSSVYQTGRSYTYDGTKKYITTMQPYVIPYGKDFTIDLSQYSAPNGQYASGSIVIPEGFSYRVKNITNPTNGTLETIDNLHYTYKPAKSSSSLLSGKIIVTLEVTKDDHAFEVEDIDLVLEFEQSHETNKMVLTRTTYSYDASTMYTDAQTAYEQNFTGYTTLTNRDHTNPVQNANTDIWFYPDTTENREKYPNAPEEWFVHNNTIEVLNGKLYFENAGKYRIYMRGRMNCAMYYSLDGGETYQLGATIKDSTPYANSAKFRPNDPNTYVDIEVDEYTWVYFKSILIVQSTPQVSYLGLGTSSWTEPMFTMVNKFYDANGNEVASEDDENYHHTITHYYDYRGVEVTEEEANNAALIPPSATAQPTYVNAYRDTYEFPSNNNFETDYFYKREYTYSYNDIERFFETSQTCIDSRYLPWDNTPTHSLNNLFDSNDNTFIHTNRTAVSASNPFSVTVKLNESVTANRLTFHGSAVNNGRYASYMPKAYKVWVSDNGTDWTKVCEVTNGTYSNYKAVAVFDEFHTFSYYKVEVTGTHARNNLGYLALNKIELSSLFSLPNGKVSTLDDDKFIFNGNWQAKQTQSTFGHLFVGQTNATLSFDFTGKRLALLSSSKYGQNFEVTIDGRKVNSIDLKEDTNILSFTYISQELENTTHHVVIKCLGEANIDCVVTY